MYLLRLPAHWGGMNLDFTYPYGERPFARAKWSNRKSWQVSDDYL
jgi:hypothetical protein